MPFIFLNYDLRFTLSPFTFHLSPFSGGKDKLLICLFKGWNLLQLDILSKFIQN